MCGPRHLFFFQCGPEMPKGWTPLQYLPAQQMSNFLLGRGEPASWLFRGVFSTSILRGIHPDVPTACFRVPRFPNQSLELRIKDLPCLNIWTSLELYESIYQVMSFCLSQVHSFTVRDKIFCKLTRESLALTLNPLLLANIT